MRQVVLSWLTIEELDVHSLQSFRCWIDTHKVFLPANASSSDDREVDATASALTTKQKSLRMLKRTDDVRIDTTTEDTFTITTTTNFLTSVLPDGRYKTFNDTFPLECSQPLAWTA